jgi:hypothetical protein
MTRLLVLVRNLILAMALAWLGLEFAPKETGKPADEASESRLALFSGR